MMDTAMEAVMEALSAHIDWGHDDRGAEDAARDIVRAVYPVLREAILQEVEAVVPRLAGMYLGDVVIYRLDKDGREFTSLADLLDAVTKTEADDDDQ